VAHEINNPATTILSRASFLLSDDVSPSDREDLQAIVAQAHRIARITGSLLSFSRPQVRRIRPTPVDRVIENSLLVVRDALESNHISVEKDLPPRLPLAMADEESLIRALVNLYRNAIDAMPGGGTLVMGTAVREAWAIITVRDTGTGMDAETRRHAFEPFFTTKGSRGTGLGLAEVYGFVRRHRGVAEIESEPGAGTVIRLKFPLATTVG
jgi:signal transduction histidine kinase